MNKLILVFIGVVGLFLVVFLNYDTSSSHIKNLEKKIVVEEEKPKSTSFENKNTPHQNDIKKDFQQKISNTISDLHVVSSAEVNGYTVAIRTLTAPQPSNSLTPPQFPTMVSGEINGEKFNLVVNDDAKKESMLFTITKNGNSASVNIDALQSVPAGQIANIGNLTPPTNLDAQGITKFEQTAQSIITQNINTSQNTQSTSIAPPSPPAIGQ